MTTRAEAAERLAQAVDAASLALARARVDDTPRGWRARARADDGVDAAWRKACAPPKPGEAVLVGVDAEWHDPLVAWLTEDPRRVYEDDEGLTVSRGECGVVYDFGSMRLYLDSGDCEEDLIELKRIVDAAGLPWGAPKPEEAVLVGGVSAHDPRPLRGRPMSTYSIAELRAAINHMAARLESGQGDHASAMCRLSLPMSQALLGYYDAAMDELGDAQRALLEAGRGLAILVEEARSTLGDGAVDRALSRWVVAVSDARASRGVVGEHGDAAQRGGVMGLDTILQRAKDRPGAGGAGRRAPDTSQPRPDGCECQWERGDGACPVHPTCSSCGGDIVPAPPMPVPDGYDWLCDPCARRETGAF